MLDQLSSRINTELIAAGVQALGLKHSSGSNAMITMKHINFYTVIESHVATSNVILGMHQKRRVVERNHATLATPLSI
jgi:hypothetical protein